MHSKATTNKRGLKACKAKDKEGNLVIDKQRNIIIKVKIDCYFKYLLSYKAISKGSSKKEYIRIFKYFKYIYLININPFSFKIYKTGIIEY